MQQIVGLVGQEAEVDVVIGEAADAVEVGGEVVDGVSRSLARERWAQRMGMANKMVRAVFYGGLHYV